MFYPQIFIWFATPLKINTVKLGDIAEELGIGISQIGIDEYILYNGEAADIKMENICILISDSKATRGAFWLLWPELIYPSAEMGVSLPTDSLGRLTLIDKAVSSIFEAFQPTCFRLAIAEECEYLSAKTTNCKSFLADLTKDSKDKLGPYYIYNFELEPM